MFEFMKLVKQIMEESKMSREEMLKLANLFYEDMEAKTVLKMLPSHIYASGSVKPGEYIALDFGGSNIRIMLYSISVDGNVNLVNSTVIKLRGELYDFTTEEYELKDIFAFIAEKMKMILDPTKSYMLGHTFSFPVEITGKNSSEVVAMTKGFTLKNAIGQDVNKLLKNEFEKIGLDVTPVSILNDTTATLLAGKMANSDTDIACIVGTGHNICFVDNDKQIVNTECGSFNVGIPITSYDKRFLEMIPQEKDALMEVLVGGKNSGKIAENFCSIIEGEYDEDFGLKNITPKQLSMALEDKYDGECDYTLEARIFLNNISRIIYNRAGQLVVSEIIGILKRIDPELERKHHIVFDGSVYEKTPYFRRCITKYIKLMYGEKAQLISHSLVKDGSSIGAAISVEM